MDRLVLGRTAILPLLLASCTGGGIEAPDLLGFWKVATHTENPSSCDIEGPAVVDPAYLDFERQQLLGATWVTYASCDTVDPTSCTGGGFLGPAYTERIDHGYRAHTSTASGTAASCMLSFTESTVILESDATLRIETRTYRDTVTVPTADDCNLEAASRRGPSMPCTNLEVLTATRVLTP